MDTNAIRAAAAAVTGARHLRSARNGQDAAVCWRGDVRGIRGVRGAWRGSLGIDEIETWADDVGGWQDIGCETRQDVGGKTAHDVGGETGHDVGGETRHDVGGGTETGRDVGAETRHDVGGGSETGRGRDDAAAVVVCDGCSSGSGSEVGARLGATLFARALGARLCAGGRAGDPAMWSRVRTDVVRVLAELLERMPGDRTEIIREHFLFTVVAAAVAGGEAAVWALGDGAYSFGDYTRVLGPFEDNAPPYLAYDLLGDARPAELAIASHPRGAIVIATDGACDLDHGLEQFLADKYVAHPDALRRQLTLLARTDERIDWAERRVVRTPAPLQDDCAVGVLRWSVS